MKTINDRRWIKPINLPNSSAGYTAIELLVIIIILGILAAIAIPSFLKFLDETKINLLAEQVRQFLRDAQLQAIGDGTSYAIRFQKNDIGLQVARFPLGSEPQSWTTLSTGISADELIFAMPESPDNTLTFRPQGDAELPGRVFLALGTPEAPKTYTQRCVNVINRYLGESYFEVNKNLACDTSANDTMGPFLSPED
jgi:type II secretory pathway pseudopilin PulG